MARRLAPLLFLLLALLPAAAATGDSKPTLTSHGADPRPERSAKDGAHASQIRTDPAWCGSAGAPVQAEAHTFHALYVIPADGSDRLGTLAPRLQADALEASNLLERTYDRALRFDMGTDCGARYLDITTIRLPQTTAELLAAASSETGTLDVVSDAIQAAGLPIVRRGEQPTDAKNVNWMVWLDGPGASGACGQATFYDDPSRNQANSNNYGGKLALMYADGAQGFCGADSLRHEIGHTLGAVSSAAPNNDGTGHCKDAIDDTMCNSGPAKAGDATKKKFFDHGNDDYWGPLPWWTVDQSRFLCPDSKCNGVQWSGVQFKAPRATRKSRRAAKVLKAKRLRKARARRNARRSPSRLR